MALATQPQSARRNYELSALIAQRAVDEATKARPAGMVALGSVVAAHQIANARTSDLAVAEMLIEQEIEVAAEAILNSAAFTTAPDELDQMLNQVQADWEFDRLIASLVQDAGRAAESVAATVRPNIWHVRFVNPPCCSRCAILAGRVYRNSTGFQRHPGCDCSMIPTTVAGPKQDPDDLVERGLVRGLSKADRKALSDGADLNQVVNIRRRESGLTVAGESLKRGGRLTPAGIYRAANGDRSKALRLLQAHGYIRR